MSPRQSHKQLSLELGSPPPSTFENFFVAANREPVQRLRDLPGLVAREQATDRLIYLWGDTGSGRTHLLHAVCDAAIHAGLNCRFLSPHHALSDFNFDPACQIYTVETSTCSTRRARLPCSRSTTRCARTCAAR